MGFGIACRMSLSSHRCPTTITLPLFVPHAVARLHTSTIGEGQPPRRTPRSTNEELRCRPTSDATRNRVLQTDANGYRVSIEYGQLNQLKKTTQHPGGVALVAETTRFDANGNPEEALDAKGLKVTNTYDEINRLKDRTYAFDSREAVESQGLGRTRPRTRT
jgi:hypothetical protein